MRLTHFVPLAECIEVLETMTAPALAAFDEAQYFGEALVSHWIDASERGVDVVVATPSAAQLEELSARGYSPVVLTMPCDVCLRAEASLPLRLPQKDRTLTLCERCHDAIVSAASAEIVERLRAQGPYPGEDALYQPVELPECAGWRVLRSDSECRAELIAAAAEEALAGRDAAGPMPTYLDIGCNTGYLCHAMRRRGFQATGVDVVKGDIAVAQLLDSYVRKDGNIYLLADAHEYLGETRDVPVDVTSAFSVFQWVMIQKSPQHGIDCILWLFEKTRAVCVLELGDSEEAHYRGRIGIEVNNDWTRNLMEEHGDFAEIRLLEAAEYGLKRDVFVGIKRPLARVTSPADESTDEDQSVAGVERARPS